MIERLPPSVCRSRESERQSVTPDSDAESSRTGKVLVMIAILLVPLFGFAAFAVDGTYLMEVKKEAENSAESAALAAALGLIDDDRLLDPPSVTQAITKARDRAIAYAAKNAVGEVANPQVDRNDANDPSGEIVIGRLSSWSYQNYPWEYDDPLKFNAVRVKVKRTADRNGQVSLFFANIFGISSSPVEAVATAITEFGVVVGFDPENGQGTILMPFAVCVQEWDEKINGIDPNPSDGVPAQLGTDQFAFNGVNSSGNPVVAAGSDGVREILMYPQNQGGGKNGGAQSDLCGANTEGGSGAQPGNFGTVDFGRSGNSTDDLVRQILYGVSEADLAYHNGGADLVLGDDRPSFELNGDTGISGGITSALESIIGQCRTIVLYTTVRLSGNNAQFTIVRYQPIRILEVKMNGNPKFIRVQPGACISNSAIIDPDAGGSNILFKPPRLIE